MKPRLLVIAPYLPAEGVSGGCTQLASLLKALAPRYVVDWACFDLPAMDRRGFASARALLARHAKDAVVVPFHGTWRDNRFTLSPEDLPIYATPEMEAAVDRLSRRGYDVVHAEFECMAPVAPFARGRRTFVTIHELNVIRRWRLARTGPIRLGPFNVAEAIRSMVWDRTHLKGLDGIAAFNPVEVRMLRLLFPRSRVAQIPIAVDLPAGTSHVSSDTEGSRRDFDMVFLGHFGHAPNTDALSYFLAKVLPELPGRSLLVIGGGMAPSLEQRARATAGVTVHGPYPKPAALVRRARVAVAPIRLGGGARLKVVEAIAAGVPVVATPIGAEGIRLGPDEGLTVAYGARDFAAAIEAVLSNRTAAREAAARGRESLRSRHSISALRDAVVGLHGTDAEATPWT